MIIKQKAYGLLKKILWARMMDLEEGTGTEDSDAELLQNARVSGSPKQLTRYMRALNN